MKKILLLLLALLPVLAQAQTDAVLVLSDVHVDLKLKPDVFYHPEDTDTALFKSAVKNAGSGKYRFIMMPGDLLSHGVTHREDSMTCTFKYVIDHVRQIDTNAVILPALGNNDCMHHNAPDTATYRIFYHALLARIDRNQSIYNTFKEGGYYSYDQDDLSVIVLNTVLFGSGPDSAAIQELDWLEKKLLESRSAHKKVWIVYHIPPGTDRYSGEPSWDPDIRDRYLAIVKAYAKIIKLQLAGHTHMKDAELITSRGRLISYVVIAPGLDTRNRNDPAYQVIHFKQREKTVKEIRTYYTNGAHPYQWQSYTFKTLNFKFLLKYKPQSSQGLDFVTDYSIRRGTVKSKSNRPIVWDAKFAADSEIL